MPHTLDDFLGLITSEHSGEPKFIAVLSAILQPIVDNILFLEGLPQDYDLDEAIGHQLDVVGIWVGASRYLGNPLPNVYFAWDTAGFGWEEGVWKRDTDPTEGLTVLDDENYRIYLRSRIAANNWDGSISQLYFIWNTEFFAPLFTLLIQDGTPAYVPYLTWDSIDQKGWDNSGWMPDNAGDFGVAGGMSMYYVLIENTDAGPTNNVIKSLFSHGYLTEKPAGVQVEAYVTQSISGDPVFAWDCPGIVGSTAPPTMLAGWDVGAWGILNTA